MVVFVLVGVNVGIWLGVGVFEGLIVDVGDGLGMSVGVEVWVGEAVKVGVGGSIVMGDRTPALASATISAVMAPITPATAVKIPGKVVQNFQKDFVPSGFLGSSEGFSSTDC
jgi:hypothetical protein